MNETLALLLRHRSIRRYTDDPISDADVRAAVKAGQRASTSSAVEAYALLRVRDEARRTRLAELAGSQDKVRLAPAFFVVLADTRRHRLAARRHGVPHVANLESFLVSTVDATLFAENVVVAFESLGYGACFVGGLRNDLPEVVRVLGLPEGVFPLYGLCVGRPAEDPRPRPRLPVDAVLLEERYPDDERTLALLDAHDLAVEAWWRELRRPGRTWTASIAEKFRAARRGTIVQAYRALGADLGPGPPPD